jgi:hypothetical protein
MGRLEKEIVITGTVRAVHDGIAAVDSEVIQGDTRLIRHGVAELQVD